MLGVRRSQAHGQQLQRSRRAERREQGLAVGGAVKREADADRRDRAQALRPGELVHEAHCRRRRARRGRRSRRRSRAQPLEHRAQHVLRRARRAARSRARPAPSATSARRGAHEILIGERAHQTVDGGLRQRRPRARAQPGQAPGASARARAGRAPARAIACTPSPRGCASGAHRVLHRGTTVLYRGTDGR